MKKICLLILILILAFRSFAHEGGHFHRNNGDILNLWELKNGATLRGNFSFGTKEFIILEQFEGNCIKIPINLLSEQDQKLARFKVNMYENFNQIPKPIVPSIEPNNKQIINLTLILFILIISIFLYYISQNLKFLPNQNIQMSRNITAAVSLVFLIGLFIVACKKKSQNSSQLISILIPKTTPSFIDSAYSPFKPLISTSWDNNYFHVESTGFPNHNMMVGITSWQQQVPIPQFYTGSNSWSIPLQPEYASTPLSTQTNLMKGAVAIAVNGIPIFNALNNRGVDSYAIGELDNWGGHCGRADDYHYHAAPLHLSNITGLKPIAFALDGFAVYGNKEPDGTNMQALDACHGHVYNNGVYHYHGTSSYPYVIGAMKGKVTLDPSTSAPENQIIPQAFANPLRPSTSPLNGAIITDFTSTGQDAYKLTYKVGNQFGFVEYNWDATKKYTYKLTDINGTASISVYQR